MEAIRRLAPLKQISRVCLIHYACELVAPTVCDNYIALLLKALQVMGHFGTEEFWGVQRGLVDHCGHDLGLNALHNTLNRACTEVVAV